MESLTAPRADDLSVLLDRINVRSAVFCLSDLGAPWGLRVDGSAAAKFHLVLDGRAMLTLSDPGATRAELSAGELVLLPHGSAHLMQDRRDSPARPLDHILDERPLEAGERLTYGGDGPRTTLLCGGFALASGLPESLLSLLPVMLGVRLGHAAGYRISPGRGWCRHLPPRSRWLGRRSRCRTGRERSGCAARSRWSRW